MKRCRIGILYNEPAPPGQRFSEASLDVLAQVEAIERTLAEIGCPCARIPFTKDVGAVLKKIGSERVDAVVNLCESVDEDPQFIGHPAAVLELLGIPFTGSPSLALMLTTDKLLSKRLLASAGLRTPGYAAYEGTAIPRLKELTFPLIVKPRFEDASIGIEQESVFRDEAALCAKLPHLYKNHGALLIEEYVDGREFNIALLGFPEPEVLPVAEIAFDEFPADLFRIVSYRAKWEPTSFECVHSPRIFPVLAHSLRNELEAIALDCFRLFMLRDYARVDVRADERGQVFVLEANANPCLSPDAGVAAAAEKGGLHYTKLIETLLQCVQKRIDQ